MHAGQFFLSVRWETRFLVCGPNVVTSPLFLVRYDVLVDEYCTGMLLTHEAQSVSDWHNLSSMKDLYIPGEALLFCCLAGFIQLHCKISFPPLIPDLLSVTLL